MLQIGGLRPHPVNPSAFCKYQSVARFSLRNNAIAWSVLAFSLQMELSSFLALFITCSFNCSFRMLCSCTVDPHFPGLHGQETRSASAAKKSAPGLDSKQKYLPGIHCKQNSTAKKALLRCCKLSRGLPVILESLESADVRLQMYTPWTSHRAARLKFDSQGKG